MQELFTRLVVLLHNPLAKEQLATQILTVRITSKNPAIDSRSTSHDPTKYLNFFLFFIKC